MIKAQVYTNSSGDIIRLEVLGHANYDVYGKDIVCAGVSALVQTAVLGIKELTDINPTLVKTEGYFKIEIPNKTSCKKCDIILKTIVLGLEDIAKSYSKYVIVKKKEVF